LVNRVRVGDGVLLGPGFRVVQCDCRPYHHKASDYCPFCLCRCKTCGGSPYGRASSSFSYNNTSSTYDDPMAWTKYGLEEEAASVGWAVLTAVLMLVGLALMSFAVHTPYYCTPALAVVAFLFLLVETWPSFHRHR